MAPFSARSLLSTGAASSSSLPTIAIVGFIVAGAIALLALGWMVIRVIRKRIQRKRENSRGAAFLSVKGLVTEGAEASWEPKQADPL
jgi:hypothetical protein